MEGCATEHAPLAEDDEKVKETDSATNFQKFVYDLFEKNGVLNDLRAYLRGHIVDVLKSAQTGMNHIDNFYNINNITKLLM